MKDRTVLERKCSRHGCDGTATAKHGNASYCKKHYRFLYMRDRARQYGKSIPSWNQLEKMLLECLDSSGELGVCPHCKRGMQWRCGDDNKIGSTISLQHDKRGGMRFLCTSCNASHGNSKLGDGWYDIQEGYKYCPKCASIKPNNSFGRCNPSKDGLQVRCRECHNRIARKYREAIYADPTKHKAHKAKQREYYAAKKQEVLA